MNVGGPVAGWSNLWSHLEVDKCNDKLSARLVVALNESHAFSIRGIR